MIEAVLLPETAGRFDFAIELHGLVMLPIDGFGIDPVTPQPVIAIGVPAIEDGLRNRIERSPSDAANRASL